VAAAGGCKAVICARGLAGCKPQHRRQQLAHILPPRQERAKGAEVCRPQLLQQMCLYTYVTECHSLRMPPGISLGCCFVSSDTVFISRPSAVVSSRLQNSDQKL
jgi:hypothetical protein